MNSNVNVRAAIEAECDAIRDMLLLKNEVYGNSAINPVRIFSKADPVEQIRIRIDDKLSRIRFGSNLNNEDTKKDLIGYLILERVAERINKNAENKNPDTLSNDADTIWNRKVY